MRFPVLVPLLASIALLLIPTSRADDQAVAKAMSDAAREWLSSLDPELRRRATLKFASAERVNWHFVPRPRKGVPFQQMQPAQQALGRALLRTGLSDHGFTQASNIIHVIEQVLHELEHGSPQRNPGISRSTSPCRTAA